jgi:hypothetical protein
MKSSAKGVVLLASLLALSGCVTSHYKDDKGCECTRRYFTPFGIPTHSCTDVCQAPAESTKAEGEELKVASLAPEPSLRQSTPAKTIEQSIKATTQALHR